MIVTLPKPLFNPTVLGFLTAPEELAPSAGSLLPSCKQPEYNSQNTRAIPVRLCHPLWMTGTFDTAKKLWLLLSPV